MKESLTKDIEEFNMIIYDLANHPTVQKMKLYRQHYDTNCFDHCYNVAFYSYLICKKLNLDYISVSRAGMLHDLFLYDWHTYIREDKSWKGQHAFMHPKIALKNATAIFNLNDIEKDVIVNHMWPVTIKIPHYKETVVVTFADKYSALVETFKHIRGILHTKKFYKYAYVFLSLIVFRII